VKAEVKGNAVIFNWQGEAGQQLSAQFSLHDGQPLVQELAARSYAEYGSFSARISLLIFRE
jgi:hypothetical protein